MDVNVKVGFTATALCGAVCVCNMEAVTILLNEGADPGSGHQFDGSPLHGALKHSSSGSYDDIVHRMQEHPLYFAVQDGDFEEVERVCEMNKVNGVVKDIDATWLDGNFDFMTPLQLACDNRYSDVARYVIAAGANLHLAGTCDWTALSKHLCNHLQITVRFATPLTLHQNTHLSRPLPPPPLLSLPLRPSHTCPC